MRYICALLLFIGLLFTITIELSANLEQLQTPSIDVLDVSGSTVVLGIQVYNEIPLPPSEESLFGLNFYGFNPSEQTIINIEDSINHLTSNGYAELVLRDLNPDQVYQFDIQLTQKDFLPSEYVYITFTTDILTVQDLENAYNDGFQDGLNDSGQYNSGYNDGFNDGLQESGDFGFGWIVSFLGLFGSIFAIELLPNLYIGTIVAIPVVFGVFFFVLKLIRG